MYIELHILQNFAPSNLNRSDTGSPKDCEFGGYRRGRVSSQCFKRAIRRESSFNEFLANNGGVRTRRLILEIAERLSEKKPAPDKITKLVSDVFNEAGIERPKVKKGEGNEDEKDNTKLLLFMDRKAIDDMVSRFRERMSDLDANTGEAKTLVIKELGEILATAVTAPDIAMFGRMIEIDGKKPFGKLNLGVDAACQVAHAISTNKISVEFDFYTAVDELLPKGDTGAGMLGTVEFNSACYYRYMNVDAKQLSKNLQGNDELTDRTIEAFVRAAIAAVPTGKQNSHAAQQRPSFIFAVARESNLCSLANAFVKPVAPDSKTDLVTKSINELVKHYGELASVYGEAEVIDKCFVTLNGGDTEALKNAKVASVDELVKRMRAAIKNGAKNGNGDSPEGA